MRRIRTSHRGQRRCQGHRVGDALKPGDYLLSASYSGDSVYRDRNIANDLRVKKATPDVSLQVKPGKAVRTLAKFGNPGEKTVKATDLGNALVLEAGTRWTSW